MTTRSAVGVDTASGKLLWEFPFKDEWNENIVTPIAVQGGVIVSGVRQGTRRLALTNSGGVWSAAEAWHTADVGMYMSSPVLARDTLFGHSTKRKGSFVAIDPGTGRIKWSTEGRDASSASIIAAGSHLLFLTSEAQLIVTALDPQAYSEVRRYTVAPSAIYAHPIVFHDRLIVRDATSVRLWRL